MQGANPTETLVSHGNFLREIKWHYECIPTGSTIRLCVIMGRAWRQGSMSLPACESAAERQRLLGGRSPWGGK